MVDSIDPYRVLGLAPEATIEEVEVAYRERAHKYHPDQGGDDWAHSQVQLAFEQIMTQRGALSSPRTDAQQLASPSSANPPPPPRFATAVIRLRQNWTWPIIGIVLFAGALWTLGINTVLVVTLVLLGLCAVFSYLDSRALEADARIESRKRAEKFAAASVLLVAVIAWWNGDPFSSNSANRAKGFRRLFVGDDAKPAQPLDAQQIIENAKVTSLREAANRAEYEGRQADADQMRRQASELQQESNEYQAWKRKNGK